MKPFFRGNLRQMFTEKYGVQQCVLAIQEALMREHHAELEEQMIHNFLRYGTIGIDEELEKTMKLTARDYAKKVFRKLREYGYDPRIMKLYDKKDYVFSLASIAFCPQRQLARAYP